MSLARVTHYHIDEVMSSSRPRSRYFVLEPLAAGAAFLAAAALALVAGADFGAAAFGYFLMALEAAFAAGFGAALALAVVAFLGMVEICF